MNTSEIFKPSFSQYFLVHFPNSSETRTFYDVSSYPELYPKFQKRAEHDPKFQVDKISSVEKISYNEYLGSDLEGEIIELQSLLDFSVRGIYGMESNPDNGLMPLLYNLQNVRSKLDSIIDNVDKQAIFYEKKHEALI